MRDILQVLRDLLFCVTPSVEYYPASLCSLELCFHKKDRDLRCLSSLRHLILSQHSPVQQDSDHGVYRLPAGLACLAISGLVGLAVRGGGTVHLDASSCSKDLQIIADPRIRVHIMGQDGCSKGACQPRVMRLDHASYDKVHAFYREFLWDAKYHKF